MPTPLAALATVLLNARHVVVFTGAGMSADSGIATFRDQADSHWSRYKPEELASVSGWKANPQRVWAWYEARRAQVMAATPNPGHLAIAQLGPLLSSASGRAVRVDVVTQNVDDLHERAGSTDVVHLHGSLFAPRCFACQRPGAFDDEPPDLNVLELQPPRCTHCGGLLRPGVVWFGEMLPTDAFNRAQKSMATCDAVLVVGTSGVVYPAAELPIRARNAGKFLAEINPTPSNLAEHMNVQCRAHAAQALPELLALIGGPTSDDQ